MTQTLLNLVTFAEFIFVTSQRGQFMQRVSSILERASALTSD